MSTSATLIFRGRLGNDPQLRTTPSGEPVANFNLAIDQGFGERKTTVWVRIAVWGKQAEACTQYLSKGDMACVHSENFRVSTWKAQDGTPQGQLEVTARRVEFIITKRAQPEEPIAEEILPF
jgi:single-strand DNA-binding protein